MSQESLQRGAKVFSSICQACHQPHGRGIKNSIPPLDGSEWLNAKVKGVPVSILLKGLKGPITVKGETFDNEMPTQGLLSDQQIADVLTYARQEWSNNSSAITAEYVAQVRKSIEHRTKPWTAQELKSMVGGKIEKEESASPFSSNSHPNNQTSSHHTTTAQVTIKTQIITPNQTAIKQEQASQISESSLIVLIMILLTFIKGLSQVHQQQVFKIKLSK